MNQSLGVSHGGKIIATRREASIDHCQNAVPCRSAGNLGIKGEK